MDYLFFRKGTGAGYEELSVTRGTATSQNLLMMNYQQAALKCSARFTLKVLTHSSCSAFLRQTDGFSQALVNTP